MIAVTQAFYDLGETVLIVVGLFWLWGRYEYKARPPRKDPTAVTGQVRGLNPWAEGEDGKHPTSRGGEIGRM